MKKKIGTSVLKGSKRVLAIFLSAVLLLTFVPLTQSMADAIGGKIGEAVSSITNALTPKANAANVNLEQTGANSCEIHDYWSAGTTGNNFVYAIINNPSGITNAEVAVWTNYGGQDDIVWYTLGYESTYNRWIAAVTLTNHCYKSGNTTYSGSVYDAFNFHFYINNRSQNISCQLFEAGHRIFLMNSDGSKQLGTAYTRYYNYTNGTCSYTLPKYSTLGATTPSGTTFYGWSNTKGGTGLVATDGTVSNGNVFTSNASFYTIYKCNAPSINTSYISGGRNVNFSGGPSGCTYYYTTNGSTPTTSSTKYTGAFKWTTAGTLKVIAVKSGYQNSDAATMTLSKAAKPTISVSDAMNGKSVTITAANGQTLYYSIDGGKNYDTGGARTMFTIDWTGTTSIKAYTIESGKAQSDVVSSSATISTKVADPKITATNYYGGKTITLSCSTSGATIYYTTDGRMPSPWSSASTKYTGAFNFTSSSKSLLAKAFKSGCSPSSHSILTPLDEAGIPSINQEKVAGGVKVTISAINGVNGQTVHYTTDGSTPTASSTKYTGAFTLTSSKTVKAIVVASGCVSSNVVSSTVTVGTTATPTISISDVIGGKKVSMSCSTSGATIYYTTDGNHPTTSSTRYTGAFTLPYSRTVKAIAVVNGSAYSGIASNIVSVGTVSAPTLSTSNYIGGKTVALKTTTDGATIYYTTNGTAPSTSSTKYTGTFNLTSTATVKAIAVKAGNVSSSAMSQSVTVDTVATPSVSSSNYVGGKTVTISCGTNGATIYYTTDGKDPTTSSSKYTASFNLTSTKTVKAIAVLSGYKSSAVGSATVSVSACAAPTITNSSINGGQSVTFKKGSTGSTLYYSTNGGSSYQNTTGASATVSLTSAGTYSLKAYVTGSGYTQSSVASKSLTISACAQPTATETGYIGGKTITLATTTSGATIYYTTDGSAPSASSTKYTGAFNLASSKTVKAIAIASGLANSSVLTKSVTVGTTATPVITTKGYVGGKTVTITCSTSGSTIYYTTDGSAPTTSSAKYTGAFNLTASKTVKAIAVASGYVTSAIATEGVNVSTAATPNITSSGYQGGKTVSISTSTSGATIYYTTNGSAPTTSSTKYTGSFNLTSSTTVKAIAICEGYVTSAVATETITVSQVAAPQITTSNYVGGKSVSISSSTTGAVIYYTTDGSNPTTSSQKYNGSFNLTSTKTIKAIAYLSGSVTSSVTSKTITVEACKAPTIDVTAKVGGYNVTLSGGTDGCSYYISLDGGENYTLYSSVVSLTEVKDYSIKAYATCAGYIKSSVSEKAVTITRCTAPTIAKTAVDGGYTIKLSNGDDGCGYFLSLDDGQTFQRYTSEVKLSKAGDYSIKAYCINAGFAQSENASDNVSFEKAAAPEIKIDNVANGKKVTVTTNTETARLYYTTNGATPTADSKEYTGSIIFDSSANFKVIAIAKGYEDSAVSSANISVGACTTPTITLTAVSGGYKVTLSGGVANSKYFLSLDGGEFFDEYTEPVTLTDAGAYDLVAYCTCDGYTQSENATRSLEIEQATAPEISSERIANGYKVTLSGGDDDAVYSISTDGGKTFKEVKTAELTKEGEYIIKAYCSVVGKALSDEVELEFSIEKVATPVILENGTLGGKSIEISCDTPDATIYYTTDGSAPSNESTEYTDAITITSDKTIRAIAYLDGYAVSDIARLSVKVDTVKEPTANVEKYIGGKRVSLTTETEGAVIYYTTNGSTPTTESQVYDKPIDLTATTVIKAIAVLDGYIPSTVLTENVTVTKVSPVQISSANSLEGKKITLSTTTPNAQIFYSTDGENYSEYAEPVVISGTNITVYAYAQLEGYVTSDIKSQSFTLPQVITPVIKETGYIGGKTVTLETQTDGAVIYYTIDGSDPTIDSTLYTAAIDIKKDTTIKAIAFLSGYAPSEIATLDVKVPTLSAPKIKSEVIDGKYVFTITSDDNADIYYTTDGKEPTSEDKLYTAPVEITGDVTVKAIAVKSGCVSSDIAEETFTNTFKVTYYVDGEEYATENHVFGETLTLIAAPEKEGYTFSGWSEIPETMPANDIEINGTFSINKYTINYYVDGELYRSEEYAFGEEVTPVEEPAKDGYTFSGWSEIPETMPANDVDVNGSFAVNEYFVKYYVDGKLYQGVPYAFGAEITALAAPEKEGYTFSGWSEIPNTMPANDVEVNGTFTVNSYDIEYYVDGKLYETKSAEYGTELSFIEAPTKEGYTFSGWTCEYTTMPAKNIKVSGTFEINKYDIKVEYANGTVTGIPTDKVTHGEEVSLFAKANAGYTFKGWYNEEELLSSRTSYSFTATKDITITALFVANDKKQLTVTVVNGNALTVKIGDGAATKQPTFFKQGVSTGVTITLDVSDSDGEFLYWTDAADSIVSYDRVFTFVHTAEASYRAVFAMKAEDYNTVTFIGAYSQIIESCAYASTDDIDIPTATAKTDYDFKGWAVDGKAPIADTNALIEAIKGLLAQGKDVTVTAIYQAKEIAYTIAVNGGSGSGEYNAADVVSITADAAPEGKKFAYWIDSTGNKVSYSTTYNFIAHCDETYTAVFVDENEEITAEPIIINSASYDNEQNKLSFISSVDVPSNIKMISFGLMITSESSVGTNADSFVEDNGQVIARKKDIADGSTQARFTLTKKNVMPGDTWYARAYLTYYDAEGNICKIYGDIVKATVNSDSSVELS